MTYLAIYLLGLLVVGTFNVWMMRRNEIPAEEAVAAIVLTLFWPGQLVAMAMAGLVLGVMRIVLGPESKNGE